MKTKRDLLATHAAGWEFCSRLRFYLVRRGVILSVHLVVYYVVDTGDRHFISRFEFVLHVLSLFFAGALRWYQLRQTNTRGNGDSRVEEMTAFHRTITASPSGITATLALSPCNWYARRNASSNVLAYSMCISVTNFGSIRLETIMTWC